MRHAPNRVPLSAPCIRIASMAYSEQVGANLHRLPSKGEIQHLYWRIKKIRTSRIFHRYARCGQVAAQNLCHSIALLRGGGAPRHQHNVIGARILVELGP